MTGGWYVCIIDIGREEGRESECSRCAGPGELRSVLKWSRAVADWAKDAAEGCFMVGEAGPGEPELECGCCFWRCAEPPHCDIKERTVKERTDRNISKYS